MWFSKVTNLRLFLQTIYNAKVMKGKVVYSLAKRKWALQTESEFENIFNKNSKIFYNSLYL